MSGREIVSKFIANWKVAVENEDIDQAMRLFAKDSRLVSPIVHIPFSDRVKIRYILTWIATEVIEGFYYKGGPMFNDDINDLRVALIFGGTVKDKVNKRPNKVLNVEGIDLFKLNKDGQIVELKVMLRPLNATLNVAQEMRERLVKIGALAKL